MNETTAKNQMAKDGIEFKAMTVHEVSQLTGISIRTLQYYDNIGLLHPSERTEVGYRLYDNAALERLQQIMLFRELEFPLKEMKEILDAPGFDRQRALAQQIELLTLKKERLENLINFARGIQWIGVKKMDFTVFDKAKQEEYAKRVRQQWGESAEYKEFLEKEKNRTPEDAEEATAQFMQLFAEFGQLRQHDPSEGMVQRQVKKLQDYISEHFYHCSDKVLASLGGMYAGGGEFTENIDRAGGEGTAEFAAKAIAIYCGE